jgi:mono/diheme cytochrome c family protein
MERKDRRALPAKPFCSTAAVVTVSSLLCWAAPVRAQSEAGDDGERIFVQNSCFVCHGQQGFGGLGPSFRNDPFLTLSDHVVGQIMLGRGVMPPFGHKLDDKQIAAVASYIRNSWGNHFGAIKPEQVAQIRRELDAFRLQASPSVQTTGSARQQP